MQPGVVVGVLFAVFGQIYQTGANAYDFFLGWTAFISLWVIIANYSPLWLVFVVLINTTFILYTQQVIQVWSELMVITIVFFINALLLVGSLSLSTINKQLEVPAWFTNVLALGVVSISTIGVVLGIFEGSEASFSILLLGTIVSYGAGLIYGWNIKSTFYLSIIPFSLIIIFSAVLIDISNDADMFFGIGVFIIVSVTVLIRGLLSIQKGWANG